MQSPVPRGAQCCACIRLVGAPGHFLPSTSSRPKPYKAAAGLGAFTPGIANKTGGARQPLPGPHGSPHSRSHQSLPSTPTLSLPGKKCTYGIKCKFYHPERPHQAQLAVADELRAQTRAWRGAGGEEERRGSAHAASLAEQGGSRDAPAARPGPREPGTRSLPPARRSAGVATLESSFSRLFLSDDPGLLRVPPRGPGCGLAPGPRGPDWVAPGSLSPLPAPPGLLSQPGLRGGYGACAPQSDRRSPRQQPGDPWVLPPGSGQLPGRSAWAESDWDDGAFGGPLRPAPQAVAGEVGARARARTALCSIFPPHEVDSIMALFPELSDVARLMLLIQRFQRSSEPVGKR